MKKIILIIAVFIISTASLVLAAEKVVEKKAADKKAVEKVAPSPSKEEVKKMPNRALAERIKGMLIREKGVINFVPGLKEMQDADKNIYYTYNGTKLEDLDNATLNRIFNRVRNEALRLRTERLQKQLNAMKQGQRIGGAAVGPKIPQISAASRLPSQPPQTPRIPKAPTAPPVPRS